MNKKLICYIKPYDIIKQYDWIKHSRYEKDGLKHWQHETTILKYDTPYEYEIQDLDFVIKYDNKEFPVHHIRCWTEEEYKRIKFDKKFNDKIDKELK